MILEAQATIAAKRKGFVLHHRVTILRLGEECQHNGHSDALYHRVTMLGLVEECQHNGHSDAKLQCHAVHRGGVDPRVDRGRCRGRRQVLRFDHYKRNHGKPKSRPSSSSRGGRGSWRFSYPLRAYHYNEATE